MLSTTLHWHPRELRGWDASSANSDLQVTSSTWLEPTGPAELIVERLNIALSAQQVAKRLEAYHDLSILAGEWTGGGAIIAWDAAIVAEGDTDPFDVLDRLPKVQNHLPGAVGGGWIGYLGYQSGRLIEHLPPAPPAMVGLPRYLLRYYDHLLRFDPVAQTWFFEALVTPARAEFIGESRNAALEKLSGNSPDPTGNYSLSPFISIPGRTQHIESVNTALEHIRAGDIFQANITLRLEAEFSGNPLDLFLAGEAGLCPAYGAYLAAPWGAVASFSPELFVRRHETSVSTSPIKGTAARHLDPDLDEKARVALKASEKDRAENLMIVDLMRNDFGRVCVPGSIEVQNLFSVKELAGVWHMVSSVTGTLQSQTSNAALLRATFPPGSVTGAPKVRSAEIIGELEQSAREIYTGSILLASPVAGLVSSVVIRTFEVADGKIWCGVGGGIVADSDPESEYNECITKAQPLLDAIGGALHVDSRGGSGRSARLPFVDQTAGVFETIATIDGRALEGGAHLSRLVRSVRSLYGDFRCPSPRELEQAAQGVALGRGRLKIVARPSSTGIECLVTSAPFPLGDEMGAVRLMPVEIAGGLGDHKWNDRSELDALGVSHPGFVPMILDGDSVLEASRSNVFAVVGSQIVTPSCDGRILPGVTRARMINLFRAAGLELRETRLTIGELGQASEVFLTNSLRGVEAVEACEGIGSWELGELAQLASKLLRDYYGKSLEQTRSRSIW